MPTNNVEPRPTAAAKPMTTIGSDVMNFTRKQTLIGGGKTFSVGAEFDIYPLQYVLLSGVRTSIQRSSLQAPAARTESRPYSQLTLTCKHRSRGLDMRPNQNYLSCNCPVQVSVRLRYKTMKYKITKLVDQHNHDVSYEHFMQYNDQKKLSEDEKHIVKEQIEFGVGTNKLKQFIKKKIGKKLDSQDIHNIRRDKNRK